LSAAEVAARIKTNVLSTSYTTLWRQFENAAIEALENILPWHIPELTATYSDSRKTGRTLSRE
jgi:hypothetical protein